MNDGIAFQITENGTLSLDIPPITVTCSPMFPDDFEAVENDVNAAGLSCTNETTVNN